MPAERRADLLGLLSLLALLTLTGWKSLSSPAPPAEDAAILMRYAAHLATGHGIVWNLGEPPVDGATDFLFLLCAAGLTAAGLSLETAVRALGVTAHALTVLLVWAAHRKLHGTPVPLAWASAAFLALGPGLAYAEAYFGTPVFALAAAASWYLANLLRRRPDSPRWALLFSLAGLTAGLIRPEGVFLAGLMLLAVIVDAGWRRSWRAAAIFVSVFAILGGAFFLWRWGYFGQPLPTPFYKKGGGTLHLAGLITSLRNACQLGFPFLFLWPLALRSAAALRRAAFSWLPVVGFVLLWVMLSGEMNFLMRFQYAIVPILAMSWPDWTAGLGRDLGLPALRNLPPAGRRGLAAFLAVAIAGVLGLQFLLYRHDVPAADGRLDAARVLSDYRGRGHTLATSEAGLLPLYSGWRSVDSWGLNDPLIARHGLTPERLEREKPALIVFHAYRSPIVAPPLGDDGWSRMVHTLESYATRHGYVLAASFGPNPFDTHTYYVRPDLADTEALVARLRALRYIWHDGGRSTVDYAALRPARAQGTPP